ncbi:low temperature requirement protein A [Phytohabitans maris]|uniref:low temperature requirement protein A n=1 Tax=Phytohabitans maris TaxID=3071409 RepID=UPI00280A972A|nr:low temperature requirement protein A [Phytohabitans sp. ZYX-F-186]
MNRATVLELFFDLAFVLVLSQLSHHLANHLSWRGLFETVVTTAALWWIWTVVTWVTDMYDSEDPALQLLVTVLTFGVIVMAVAIQGAFDGHGMIFAAAYVGVHLIRNIAVLVVGRGKALNLPSLRMLLWPLVSAPLWFVGAALHGGWQLWLWTVGIVVDYESIGARRPVPLLGGRRGLWQVGGEHLAERYRQLLLMGLGDAFLTMGAAWLDTPSTPLRGATIVLTFLYTTLLFQSYFRVAGQRLAEMIAESGNKVRVARLAVDFHLLMLLGIVITSVGIDLIIRHPLERTHGFWTAVIVVGPALFMLGRILFGRLVLSRLSPSREIALIGLLAITPLAGVLPPILTGVAATAVLAVVQLPRISKRFARWIHEPVLEEE